LPQMLTSSRFSFNTLTFGYFYDHFVRSCRMKIAENNKTADSPELRGIDGLGY
jgi:hypothetical protein